jgi:hypothetical protein
MCKSKKNRNRESWTYVKQNFWWAVSLSFLDFTLKSRTILSNVDFCALYFVMTKIDTIEIWIRWMKTFLILRALMIEKIKTTSEFILSKSWYKMFDLLIWKLRDDFVHM